MTVQERRRGLAEGLLSNPGLPQMGPETRQPDPVTQGLEMLLGGYAHMAGLNTAQRLGMAPGGDLAGYVGDLYDQVTAPAPTTAGRGVQAFSTALGLLPMTHPAVQRAAADGLINLMGLEASRYGPPGLSWLDVYHGSPHKWVPEPIPDELPAWAPAERMAQWRTARANAALPVQQGGLGLGPANTAAERAAAQGFDVDALHGRPTDFGEDLPISSFDNSRLGSGEGGANSEAGHWLTDSDVVSSLYAKNGEVMPLKLRAKDMMPADWHETMLAEAKRDAEYLGITGRESYDDLERIMSPDGSGMWGWMGDEITKAKKQGYAGVTFKNVHDAPVRGAFPLETEYVVFDPARIRSRFAAFDPMRRDEADLLASWLLPALLGGGLAGAGLLGQQPD